MRNRHENHYTYLVLRIIVAALVFLAVIIIGNQSLTTGIVFFLLIALTVIIGIIQLNRHHSPHGKGDGNSGSNSDGDGEVTPAPSRQTSSPEPDGNPAPGQDSVRLLLRQHIFTFGEHFTVYDEHEQEKYRAYGEMFEIGSVFHITDLEDNELAWIDKKLFSFQTTYYINVFGKKSAELVKSMEMFANDYTVSAYGWNISGEFLTHEYTFYYGDHVVATVSKEFFTLGDAYSVEIFDKDMELEVLATVIAIDDIIDSD